MFYKLNLDENKYLTGFMYTGTEEDTFELNASEMNLDYLNCYKLVGDEIIFDEEKYTSLVDTKAKEQKIMMLKKELESTDYIACKIAEGAATKEEYKDELSHRQELRDKINRLQEELNTVKEG